MNETTSEQRLPVAWSWQPRYTVVLACSLAMFISYVDRVNISVAVLAMQEEFGWSDSLKGTILASFFIGYMLMQILGGWLAHVYGGRRVLIVSLVAWSVCTVLTPVAAHWWLPLLFALRIALGLSEGPLNPAVYNIFSFSVPAHERARAVALYSSAGFLGTFAALISTGVLIKLYGWEAVFYLFGAMGLIYAMFVGRLLDGAATGLQQHSSRAAEAGERNNAPIPWLLLLRQGPFWALVFSFFCTSWIFYVLLLWMPSYFARAHGLKIVSTGMFSLTPWIIMFLVMNLAGWLSDHLLKRGITTTKIRKTLTATGLFGSGALLMGIHGVGSPGLAMLLLCLALGFLALAYASQAPNVFDLAPRYAGVLFSILNTFGSLPGIIGVALTGLLVELTHSFDVPLALAGVLAWLGATIYLMFGTARQLVH